MNLYTLPCNNPIVFSSNHSNIFSNRLNGSFGGVSRFVSGLSAVNGSKIWLDLGIIGDIWGYIDDGFSIFAGWIDGIRNIKHLKNAKNLNIISNVLMGIGIVIDVGLSLYDNLTVPGLTPSQRAGNIVGDVLYIAISQTITWGVAALVAMIPYVGWVLAPVVGFAVGQGLDYLWNGGGLLGMLGVETWKPGGKTIQQHVGDFFAWLFGGCK